MNTVFMIAIAITTKGLRCLQRDERHRAIERAALGREDAADAKCRSAEFAVGRLSHHDDLLAQPHAELFGQLAADQDVAIARGAERPTFDDGAVDEGDLLLGDRIDAEQHDPLRLGRAAGQRRGPCTRGAAAATSGEARRAASLCRRGPVACGGAFPAWPGSPPGWTAGLEGRKRLHAASPSVADMAHSSPARQVPA
jgi:hypothetical protein